MADGGATYTVNIELATRQFSQDLRNLKNKIKNELGKTVKVATGGTGGGAVAREKAKAIREQRQQDVEDRRKAYATDKKNAQLSKQGQLVRQVNALASYGLNVASKRKKLEDIHDLANQKQFQKADEKIKQLTKEIEAENKILDTIIKQGVEKDKQVKQRIEQARKLENRQRKGPHGQRMYGPVDSLGNPIYTGRGPKPPAIPKSGASLPIDLQRKTSGTFAAKHTDLLRRRQVLETLLSSFDGINTPEINRFKNGIQGLVKQYGAISTSMGQTRNASGFGNAGNIARELELLELSTKKEEYRARNIKTMNQTEAKAFRTKEAFLNKEHSIKKTLFRLQKKGLATTNFELKLEKAITAQDQEQLNNLAREVDMANAKATRATKKASGSVGGGVTSGGGTSAAKGGGGKLGRIAQSAMISGGFPLLFGQSAGVAGASAVGAGIGEALTPGGGFAGGIITSALASKVAEAIQFRKEIDKVNKSILAAGGSSVFTAQDIRQLGKSLNMTKEEALNAAKSFAAFDASVRKSLLVAFGDEATFNLVKGLKTNKQLVTDIQAAEGKIGRSKADQLLNLIKTEGSLKVQKKLQDAILEVQKKNVTGTKDQVSNFDKFMSVGKTINRLPILRRFTGLEPGKGKFGAVSGEDIRDKRMEDLLGTSQQDAARQLGEELNRAFRLELITNIATVRDEIEMMQTPLFRLTQTAQVVGDAFGESFRGIVSGSMSARQALGNLFQRTADMFLDMAAKMIAKQIQMKILGIGLQWFGNVNQTSGFTGRGSTGTDFKGRDFDDWEAQSWGTRATGGPVSRGNPYVVGERGPELFVPGSSGNIVPNNAMGGANIVVNVDASGSEVQGNEGQAAMLGRAISSAVTEEIARQKRPGGLLSAA